MISFKNKKLKKQLRLSQIEAADNLFDLKKIPGPRLHSLKGNRFGQLSVDLDHPYRFIFVPDHDPIPELPSGGMDWNNVVKVKIMEITDTHE